MKKLIIPIILISGILFNTGKMMSNTKKQQTYTYEQGLEVSMRITACFMGDSGIKQIITESLDRFEKETGSRDFVTLIMVKVIALEYGLEMWGEYLPFEKRKYIKDVMKRCRLRQ